VRLISAYAYGVPAQEFSSAMIVAKNSIGQPDYFEESIWDATRELALSALTNPEPAEHRMARYNFLWDALELERRKQSSKLWSHLAPLTTAISRRYRLYPGTNRDELERRLAQTSVMLEERMRELVGAVELVHSSYYGNQAIVAHLARFIAQVHLGPGPVAVKLQPAGSEASVELAHAPPEHLPEESRPV
jgi:hypothetical protein